jgi:hypothetical protein
VEEDALQRFFCIKHRKHPDQQEDDDPELTNFDAEEIWLVRFEERYSYGKQCTAALKDLQQKGVLEKYASCNFGRDHAPLPKVAKEAASMLKRTLGPNTAVYL